MANPYPIYASELTWWKCPRALFYHATQRNKKPELDEATVQRLNHYTRLETIAIILLQENGWNIIKPDNFQPGIPVKKEDQELFIYKDKDDNDVMRGRIDLIACPPGVEIGGLFEVKTVNENIFNKCNHIRDFLDLPHWWSGQLAQWVMYMYMSGKNYGGIIQYCRETGQIKIHYASILKDENYYDPVIDEFAQKIIANIDEAWAGALLGTEPDFCGDLALCHHCWCKGNVCFPPVQNPGIETGFIGTTTRDEVARMLELEPMKKEYDNLKKKIEAPLKISIQDHGTPEEGFLIGEGGFLAKAKVSQITSYKVPDEIKKQYEHKGQRISIIIEPI